MQVLFPRESHDLTWTSCMKPAVVAMIKLVHEVVYDLGLDWCLKQGVKCGKAISDILAHEEVKVKVRLARLDEVKVALAQMPEAATSTSEGNETGDNHMSASSVSMEMAEYINTWSTGHIQTN